MVAEILRASRRPARSLVGGMIAYGEHLEAVKVPLRAAEKSLSSFASSIGAAKAACRTSFSPRARLR